MAASKTPPKTTPSPRSGGLIDKINDRIKKIDGEAIGRKIGDAIRKKAEEKLKGIDPKKAGEKLGKKVAEKIGRAIGLPQRSQKLAKPSSPAGRGKRVKSSSGRAENALHNAAVRMGKSKQGSTYNISAEEREARAVRMRNAQSYRWE